MVPEGWIPTMLEHIAEPRTGLQTGPFGSQLKASEYADEGIPVIMPKDIRDGRVVDDTAARVSESTAASLHKHRCEVGDILFGRRGDIGRCAVITSKERGWLCGTGCLRARPRAGTVDADFLTQQLRQQSIAAWLTEHAVGQTMLNLNTSILGALPLLLPPLPEQRKIAAILSSVDEAIEKTQAVIDQVQVVKKGLMQELLTRGLPGRHTKFKQTEIGEIPDDWEVTTIGDRASLVTSGSRGWAEFYSDSGARFLRITNLVRGDIGLDLSDLKYVNLPPGSSEGTRTRIEPGDILISITAELGLIGWIPPSWDHEAYINQHIALVRFSTGAVDNEFAAYFLTGPVAESLYPKLNDAGAKAGLNLTSVRRIPLALPPMDEQREIARVFSSLDVRLMHEREQLDRLASLKQALMSVLLTGEVRVKVDPEATA